MKSYPIFIFILLINDEYAFPYVITKSLSSAEIVFLRPLTV